MRLTNLGKACVVALLFGAMGLAAFPFVRDEIKKRKIAEQQKKEAEERLHEASINAWLTGERDYDPKRDYLVSARAGLTGWADPDTAAALSRAEAGYMQVSRHSATATDFFHDHPGLPWALSSVVLCGFLLFTLKRYKRYKSGGETLPPLTTAQNLADTLSAQRSALTKEQRRIKKAVDALIKDLIHPEVMLSVWLDVASAAPGFDFFQFGVDWSHEYPELSVRRRKGEDWTVVRWDQAPPQVHTAAVALFDEYRKQYTEAINAKLTAYAEPPPSSGSPYRG